MKELRKLITKDIFDCLSEEDARQLEEIRARLNISDEDYRQMKARVTSRELHEQIVNTRKHPRRVMIVARYAAILALPLAVAVYFWLNQESQPKTIVTAQVQQESILSAPVRKQPRLIFDDGKVVNLGREVKDEQITLHAVNRGNELEYEKNKIADTVKVIKYNTVEVPKGGEYHVSLADGTKVWFNEETRLRFPVAFAGTTRDIYLESGEIYLDVERDEEHPFIVHTVNGDVHVLGTEFNVKSNPDHSVITTLVEGKVRVSRDKAEAILLPNQQAFVAKTTAPICVENVDVEEFVSWKDNIFFFKDEALETILDKLADWYGFSVFYENPEAKAEKYFVRIDKYAEVNKILEVISDVSNVKFKINGKTVSVYK